MQDYGHCMKLMYGKITACDTLISQVVDKTTEEANIIMQYVKNTHAATHNTYTLEVQEVSNFGKRSFNMTTYYVV